VSADIDHEVAGRNKLSHGVDGVLSHELGLFEWVQPLGVFDQAVVREMELAHFVAKFGEWKALAWSKEARERHRFASWR
jgi:hypothetical protein